MDVMEPEMSEENRDRGLMTRVGDGMFWMIEFRLRAGGQRMINPLPHPRWYSLDEHYCYCFCPRDPTVYGPRNH